MYKLEYIIKDLDSLNQALVFLSSPVNQMPISLQVNDIGNEIINDRERLLFGIFQSRKRREASSSPVQSTPQLIQALSAITRFYEQNPWASGGAHVVHMCLDLSDRTIDKEAIRILATLFENGTYPPGFKLDLSQCNLTDEDVRPLFTAMLQNNCKHPFKLNLVDNKLRDLALLSRVLASGATMKGTEIDVSHNKITSDGARPFFHALSSESFPSDMVISISSNLLDNSSVDDFSVALTRHFPKHLLLRLSSSNFNDKGVECLMSALCEPECQVANLVLHLEGWNFGSAVVYRALLSGTLPLNKCRILGSVSLSQFDNNTLPLLQEVLAANKLTECLNLNLSNQQNPMIGQLLISILEDRPYLSDVSLDLEATKLDSAIYVALVTTLSSANLLRRFDLNLASNSLDSNFAPALAQLIMREAMFERLSINLKLNPIDLVGIKLLCFAICRANIVDFSLSLECIPNFSLEYVKEIAKMLAGDRLAEKFTLDLSNNAIDDEGIELLMDAIVGSKCRTKLILNLEVSDPTLEGIRHIARALVHPECPANLTILIGSNEFTRQGLLEIADAFKSGKLPPGIRVDFGICNAWNPDVTLADVKALYLARKVYLAESGVKRTLLQKQGVFATLPREVLENISKLGNLARLPIDNKVSLIIELGRSVDEINQLGDEQPQHVQQLLQLFQKASVSSVALDEHWNNLQLALISFLREEFLPESERCKSSRVTEILYNKGIIDENFVIQDKSDASKFKLSAEFFETLQKKTTTRPKK